LKIGEASKRVSPLRRDVKHSRNLQNAGGGVARQEKGENPSPVAKKFPKKGVSKRVRGM